MKKVFTLLLVIFTSISYSQSWKYKTVKNDFDRGYDKSALTPPKRTINQLYKRQDYSLRLDSSLEFSPSDYSKTTDKLLKIELTKAITYLKHRGLTKVDILRYDIGYCSDGKYAGRIIIPSYDSNYELNYFVSRTIYEALE